LDFESLNAKNAIDLTAVITTPENIQFEYRIAGPFRRLPALLIDFVIRIIGFSLLVFAFSIMGVSFPVSISVLVMAGFLAYFALDWFYGILFETYWNGQTPGKWLTKIRVISTDGRPINAYHATIRNFLRFADFAPMVSFEVFSADAPPYYGIPTFLVSLICMTITSRFQRLGDIAAGTMVIVNDRTWITSNVKLEDPRVASLSEYIPANFRMSSTLAKAIALYAERRARIPIARRLELASHLARPLLKQFDFREDTSPDLLLCALYYREFVAKEAFTEKNRFTPPPPKLADPLPPTATSSSQISLPPLLNTPAESNAVLSVPISSSKETQS